MFGRRITLFRVFGFEVRLDASWLMIAALIIWSLATGLFPTEYPGLSFSIYWWMGALGALGLFGSIVVHELCHSLVANFYKLPMRGITLFIFGGVAEMGGEPENPKVELLMAVAGPVASIILGFIFYLIRLAGEGHWPRPAIGILAYLAWINWMLALFNLIPAFPLDGGRILRAAMWRYRGDLQRATRIASRFGSAFGFLLMAFGFYELFAGNLISAIWYFLIGMFLRGASRASYEQVLLRASLQGEPIRRFVKPDPITVPPDITIRQLVDDYIYRYHFRMFPVVDDSKHLVGCIGTADVKQIPREEWERQTVREVARPSSEANTVTPDTDALQVLSKMRDSGTSGLLVTERERLMAIVSLKDLVRLLATKLDLEGGPHGLPHGSHP